MSEAIQCNMCYSWVHAACEGLKKEQYKQLTQLTNSIDNIVYYCSLNRCAPLNKKLIQEHLDILRQNTDIPSLRSFQAEQGNLHRIISDVSLKIEDVSSQYTNLQKQIQDLHFQNNNLEKQIANTSEVINSASIPAATATSEPPATAALSIADELADRERRKNNLIIYKLAESNNHSSDKTNVAKLCKTVFDIDVRITKSMWLGKKSEDKTRPLLICLDSQQNAVYNYNLSCLIS